MPRQETNINPGRPVRYCAGCRKYVPDHLFASHMHDYDRQADEIARAELRRQAQRRYGRTLSVVTALASCGVLVLGGMATLLSPVPPFEVMGQVQAWTQERWPIGTPSMPPFDEAGNISLAAAGQVVFEAMDAVANGNEAQVLALTSSRPGASARVRLQAEITAFQSGGQVVYDQLITGDECGPTRCELTVWAFVDNGPDVSIYDWSFVVVPEDGRLVVDDAQRL